MKHQITRFSPHQNAKVFAVLMAITSLVFLVPFLMIVSLASPHRMAPPALFMILTPIVYLLIGYIMTVIWCAVFNVVAKYTGGIEFESAEV